MKVNACEKSEYKEYLDTLKGIEKIYIQNRLIRQIIWYDEKSRQKQMCYKVFTLVGFIFTASIPCLSIFNTEYTGIAISILISIIGAVTSVMAAVVSLCEYQKLWIQYRIDCEILKGILYRYMTKSGEFYCMTKQDAFHLLVSVTDKFIQSDFMSWNQLSHSCNDMNHE